MQNFRNLIQQINDSDYKVSLVVTGGGSESIGELLRYGGGSNTLIEAVVPYGMKAFDNYVKGKPDKYCSPEAARDLAMAAFQRAVKFEPDIPVENLIGIAATCSLVKENERKGREHKVYITVQTQIYTHTYSYTILSLQATYEKNRKIEEECASILILRALSLACNLHLSYPKNVEIICEEEKVYGGPELSKLILQTQPEMIVSIGKNKENQESRVILSGSFNPPHAGHEQLAEMAYESTGKPVDFEICVHNVDKPALNFQSITERINTIREKYQDKVWMGDVILTSSATFAEKAELFPECQFVVGFDTFQRIGEKKYYASEQSMLDCFSRMKELGCKFLVHHRITNGEASTEEDFEKIIPELRKIAELQSSFPDVEISSTAIRNS